MRSEQSVFFLLFLRCLCNLQQQCKDGVDKELEINLEKKLKLELQLVSESELSLGLVEESKELASYQSCGLVDAPELELLAEILEG